MRLIDADALLKASRMGKVLYFDDTRTDGYTDVLLAVEVERAPTIEAELVRHGRWEYNDEGDPICTVCGNSDELSRDDYYCRGGKIRDSDSAYCPWCGAKMDGGNA